MNAIARPASQAAATRIVIAAGGTGGHLFPAEALAAELIRRGHGVMLLTDKRSGALSSAVFAGVETHVLEGAGLAGRGWWRAAKGAVALVRGTRQAKRVLRTVRPAAIVAFGGYPSVPPVLAARLATHRVPVILHEQNAVLGRANRALARFAAHLALGMEHTARLPARVAATVIGNPVRPAVAALAGAAFHPPGAGDPINLLVSGGSLGARIFADSVPAALARLDPALRSRLRVTQQCRAEDMDRVRAAYAALGMEPELSPFLADMARRIEAAHLVIGRAGASTCAEIAVIGRPAILVPLPGAIDGHQTHNAGSIDATVLEQSAIESDPDALPRAITDALLCQDRLAMMAHATAGHGRPHAAAALADLVEATMRTRE